MELRGDFLETLLREVPDTRGRGVRRPVPFPVVASEDDVVAEGPSHDFDVALLAIEIYAARKLTHL